MFSNWLGIFKALSCTAQIYYVLLMNIFVTCMNNFILPKQGWNRKLRCGVYIIESINFRGKFKNFVGLLTPQGVSSFTPVHKESVYMNLSNFNLPIPKYQ